MWKQRQSFDSTAQLCLHYPDLCFQHRCLTESVQLDEGRYFDPISPYHGIRFDHRRAKFIDFSPTIPCSRNTLTKCEQFSRTLLHFHSFFFLPSSIQQQKVVVRGLSLNDIQSKVTCLETSASSKQTGVEHVSLPSRCAEYRVLRTDPLSKVIVPLFVGHILRWCVSLSVAWNNADYIQYNCRQIRKVEQCGIVEVVTNGYDRQAYVIKDATGSISCHIWLQGGNKDNTEMPNLTGCGVGCIDTSLNVVYKDTNGNASVQSDFCVGSLTQQGIHQVYHVGQPVRIRGTIRQYKGETLKEIAVTHICKISQHDLEVHNMTVALRDQQEYTKPWTNGDIPEVERQPLALQPHCVQMSLPSVTPCLAIHTLLSQFQDIQQDYMSAQCSVFLSEQYTCLLARQYSEVEVWHKDKRRIVPQNRVSFGVCMHCIGCATCLHCKTCGCSWRDRKPFLTPLAGYADATALPIGVREEQLVHNVLLVGQLAFWTAVQVQKDKHITITSHKYYIVLVTSVLSALIKEECLACVLLGLGKITMLAAKMKEKTSQYTTQPNLASYFANLSILAELVPEPTNDTLVMEYTVDMSYILTNFVLPEKLSPQPHHVYVQTYFARATAAAEQFCVDKMVYSSLYHTSIRKTILELMHQDYMNKTRFFVPPVHHKAHVLAPFAHSFFALVEAAQDCIQSLTHISRSLVEQAKWHLVQYILEKPTQPAAHCVFMDLLPSFPSLDGKSDIIAPTVDTLSTLLTTALQCPQVDKCKQVYFAFLDPHCWLTFEQVYSLYTETMQEFPNPIIVLQHLRQLCQTGALLQFHSTMYIYNPMHNK